MEKRIKTLISKEESLLLWKKGLISKATAYRSIASGWIALGWQKRGENFNNSKKAILKEIFLSLGEGELKLRIAELLQPKTQVLTQNEINNLNEAKMALTINALRSNGYFRGFSRAEVMEIADKAFCWALETFPETFILAKRVLWSRALNLAGKKARENKKMATNTQYEGGDCYFDSKIFIDYGKDMWNLIGEEEDY